MFCPGDITLQFFYPLSYSTGFSGNSAGENPPAMPGDPSLIPGLGRTAGKGIDYPLQDSSASLVAQLVKNPPAIQMTWVDPWVGKIPWRREWPATSIFWPGEFHGLYSPWGHKELDTTEQLSLSLHSYSD